MNRRSFVKQITAAFGALAIPATAITKPKPTRLIESGDVWLSVTVEDVPANISSNDFRKRYGAPACQTLYNGLKPYRVVKWKHLPEAKCGVKNEFITIGGDAKIPARLIVAWDLMHDSYVMRVDLCFVGYQI